MAWYTEYTTKLWFNRKTYDNLSVVENDLEEIEDFICCTEKDLNDLAMITEPKKFCGEDEDPMAWIQVKVRECLEELRSLYVDRFKLQCLRDGWDHCHTKDGDPIHPPKELMNVDGYDCSYIDGDFIYTKEEKNEQKEKGLGF